MSKLVLYVLLLSWLSGAAIAVAGSGGPLPVPRPKPQRETPSLSTPLPRQKPAATAMNWPAAEIDAAKSACVRLLRGLNIRWSPVAAIGQPGDCGALAPIDISAVDGVEITPPATVTCELAAALHHWVSTAVQPNARRDLGTRAVAIHTAASYVCRSRNNVNGGKLSEHAKANALDMSGFSFAKGDGATVGDGWGGLLGKIGLSSKGSFLDHIQVEACNSFTTVLGPESDSYHGNHFHVDVLARKNGYRICQ